MRQILMQHGWGFTSAVFSPLKELLADFIVETPDRPGYGDRTTQTQGTAMPALQSPTIVIGWSLGGLDAIQLALRQPDRVSALVLLASTPCFVNRPDWSAGMDEAVFDAFRDQLISEPQAAIRQFIRLNAGMKIERKSRDLLNELSTDVNSEVLLAGLDELEGTDLRDVAKKIEVPVLLLHAVDDRIVPITASRWLEQSLPNARLVEFPDGGHAFFLQQGDKVAELIRAMA